MSLLAVTTAAALLNGCAATPPTPLSSTPPVTSDETTDMPPFRQRAADPDAFGLTERSFATLSDDGTTLTISRIESPDCETEPTAFSYDGESEFTVTFDLSTPNPELLCTAVAGFFATEFTLASAPAVRPVTVRIDSPVKGSATLRAE